MVWRSAPLPTGPVMALEPFRIADRYGLFARMTRGRYEIEFQGSKDGQNWTTYQFRNKPQDPHEAPRIYAPYQPRFDWNLWFASLSDWRSDPIVVRTEERLLAGSPDVVALFAVESVSAAAASYRARRDLAILVQHARAETHAGHLVDAAAARALCADAGAPGERQTDGAGVAVSDGCRANDRTRDEIRTNED